MFYKNDITNNENGLSVPMLTEAVETIAACSNDLMVVAEAIIQSCNLVENLDEAHKDILVTRADALKRLASLYKSRSVRFKAVAQKLVEGAVGDTASLDLLMLTAEKNTEKTKEASKATSFMSSPSNNVKNTLESHKDVQKAEKEAKEEAVSVLKPISSRLTKPVDVSCYYYG